MAVTYKLIETITVGSGGAASIAFASIPQTYTDLLIKLSLRSTNAVTNRNVYLNPNGSSANATARILLGDGSSVGSSTSTRIIGRDIPAASATSSVFGNAEFYIPNYRSSVAKSISADTVMENNATASLSSITANLWNVTDAITTLTFVPEAGDFAQYSSASLYGISNS
jgi:hypothetical protein